MDDDRAYTHEIAIESKPLLDSSDIHLKRGFVNKSLKKRSAHSASPQRRAGDRSRSTFNIRDFLSHAGIGKAVEEFRKGTSIFSQGDPANAIHYIQKGRVKLSVVSKAGKEAVVALLAAGDFLGESCIASGHSVRLSTAVALSDCVVLTISQEQMLRVLREQSALSEVFVSFLLERNARIQADLVDQLFNSSEKRLARTLLLLAQFGREGNTQKVIPKLSQETLAEMVGTTRSRVSHFMNRFRELGFIEYNGEITVHNSLLSVVLHD